MKLYDCIFLDRDGTINWDKEGYIKTLADFKFFEFTFKALKKIANLGNRFCIVTNQSGVSRGLIKQNELNKIHNYIRIEFETNGIPLLNIYECIDHPDNASNRRKPGFGMFLEAKTDYGINLPKCLMIGDSQNDMQAGQGLGMDTMLVKTGNGKNTLKNLSNISMPQYIVKDLNEGAEKLCH